jgi:hypothetical protein
MKQNFKIESDKARQFVNRELKKRTNALMIGFGICLVGFLILSIVTKAYFIIPMSGVLFGVVFLFVSSMFKGDLETLARAFRFEITDDSISRFVEWDRLSPLQKIRAQRATAKYGEHLEQVIKAADIESVVVKENEIVIKSKNANPINGNGTIAIPEEVENFGVIKNHFSSYPKV